MTSDPQLGYSFYWCTNQGAHHHLPSYHSLLRQSPVSTRTIPRATDHHPHLPCPQSPDYGHYPTPWRVNTVLSNQPQFAEAFGCPIGSRLNQPTNRCAVW